MQMVYYVGGGQFYVAAFVACSFSSKFLLFYSIAHQTYQTHVLPHFLKLKSCHSL